MRITKNKVRVLEALAFIDAVKGMYPPYNAVRVQRVLQDDFGYGDYDLPNLTRTLKTLVDQGLVKCSLGSVDMSGQNGFVQRPFEQHRMKYWPADLDLAAMRVHYKITPEDYDLRFHNFFQRRYGLPELTMEEFRAYSAHKAVSGN
jgi:hypothetical protein